MPNTKSTKSTKEWSLKHYEKYKIKLESFCRLLGIKVVRAHCPSDGAWVPSRNKIVLDHDLCEIEEIATWLHELGHCIDDSFLYTYKVDSKIYEAYANVYDDKITKKQLKLVVQTEKRAWDFGKHLAKRLGIKLGKWYDDIAKDSVKSYKKLA